MGIVKYFCCYVTLAKYCSKFFPKACDLGSWPHMEFQCESHLMEVTIILIKIWLFTPKIFVSLLNYWVYLTGKLIF